MALREQQMTRKRDLKRRVRERQARTGESYMTALRHVLGEPPSPVSPVSPMPPVSPVPSNATAPIPVVEFTDLSDIAAALGIKCRVMVSPVLVERVDVAAMLAQLHHVLTASARDRDLAIMRAVVLRGERPVSAHPAMAFRDAQFVTRARLGIGGVSDSGHMLAFTVAGRHAAEHVLLMLWVTPLTYVNLPPALIVAPAHAPLGEPIGDLDLLPRDPPDEP